MLTHVGDARAWIIAYDNGVLEIRMPYQEQEIPIIILAYFVNAIADELEIEAMQLGALLLEKIVVFCIVGKLRIGLNTSPGNAVAICNFSFHDYSLSYPTSVG